MKTKKQKRGEMERAALRQRVADIATGAAGYLFDRDGECASAEFLERFIPALEARFGFEREQNGHKVNNLYLFKVFNLANYNDVSSATDFLFEHDVRA